MQPQQAAAHGFLCRLFGDELPEGTTLSIVDLARKTTDHCLSIDKAAELAAGKPGFYFGVGLGKRGANYGPKQRPKSEEIVGLFGVWADIDIDDPVHQKANLPPSMDGAMWIANSLGLKPTIVVNSGHGIQAYWLFKEFFRFETDADRQEGLGLAEAWQKSLHQKAKERGWAIDSTGDGARILRIPGTVNAKVESNPKPVTIIYDDGPIYDVTDVKDSCLVELGKIDFAAASQNIYDGADVTATPELPVDLMAALLENHDKFKATWEKKRRDLKNDSSPSGYCMALASIAASAGWTKQQIVDLQIAWRAKHNLELHLNNPGKHIRTASNAIEWAASNPNPEPVIQEPADSAERKQILASLTPIFGFDVAEWIQYSESTPRYSIRGTSGVLIDCGTVDDVYDARRFGKKIYGYTGRPCNFPKPKEYPKFLHDLGRIRIVHADEDDNKVEVVRGWCRKLMESSNVRDAEDAYMAMCSDSPFVQNGALWVNAIDFHKYIVAQFGVKHDAKVTREYLKIAGFTYQPQKSLTDPKKILKKKNRPYWYIPRDFVYPDSSGDATEFSEEEEVLKRDE